MLLNNCPKLTHLSLTGVQAFLRDELLHFCREAPAGTSCQNANPWNEYTNIPLEFNEHQRDVFCVFSGSGVQRLRDYLNDNRNQRLRPNLMARGSEDPEGIDLDLDDNAPGSGSGSTPVMSFDVQSQQQAGMTPVMPGPLLAGLAQQQMHYNHMAGLLHGGPPGSASYPPTGAQITGGALWAGGITPVAGGAAQQVTGMMGATMLDDVDEGDEAFGEESEIMGD